jgi:hypothetical protein
MSLHDKKGLGKKIQEKNDAMSWFWYTLKNLDLEVKIFWEIWVQVCR